MMNTIGPLGRTKSEAFWRSRLAICSAVAVLFLSLSGLVVWLWPFGPLAQITVLVHTLLGLVFIVPVVVYGIRHWLDYRQQALTHTKFLGYLSTGVLIACGISGLILTYQPLFGTRISYFWRAVHDWTTVALLIFVLPHILIPAFRAARAQLSDSGAAVWQAVRSFGTAVVVLTSCLLACILLADYAYEPPRMAREFSPDYDLWEPKNPLYGKNRPFAPSLARTIDNKPIDARLLSGSEGCGTSGCHQQILQEWKPSAHRYSAMDKAF